MSEKTNVNPMPDGGKKTGATAIKSLIGIAAVGDIVMSAISFGLRKKDEEGNKRGIAIFDGIDLILTLVDFGLSCGVGYGIYSPMDTSNNKISNSDYKNMITNTSDAAGKYSDLWIYKTVISLFLPSISAVKTIAIGDEENEFMEYINILNSACHAIMCLISAIYEIIACIEAGKVDCNKLTNKQKKDRLCFIFETVGFICDDACAVVDEIISIANLKNIPIIVVREVLEASYAVMMFIEAGYINNA